MLFLRTKLRDDRKFNPQKKLKNVEKNGKIHSTQKLEIREYKKGEILRLGR